MAQPSGNRLAPIHAQLRAGDRIGAERACAALLERDPHDAGAWSLLGGLQLDRGAPADAAQSLQRAAALDPEDADILLRLAVARFRCGDKAGARATLDALLAVHPRHAAAAFHVGLLCEQDKDDIGAERHYRLALEVAPAHAEALERLGTLLHRLGRHREALETLSRAWNPNAQRPQLAELIARVALDTGAFGEAAHFAVILTGLAPRNAHGWLFLGIAARQLGDAARAAEALQRALELAPGHALALFEQACNHLDLGCYDAALASFAQARNVAPDWLALRWVDALALPAMLETSAQLEGVLERYAQGLGALRADLATAMSGRPLEVLDALGRVTPFRLHYLPANTTQLSWDYGDLVESAVRGHIADAPLLEPLDWHALAHGGRLRIGFVSCEMRLHTITRYFEGWLTGLDRARFEVHAWHLGARVDEVTARIAARADAFHHDPTRPSMELAAMIRAARLDVLVYLEIGMDSRPQMLAALRLAPVQCAAFGHPVTTGLRTLDWFLSAQAIEPGDAQSHYRERLEQLPGLGVAPTPTPAPGDAGWLPRAQGRPLLLCLQSLFKLAPAFDEAVARIVEATDAKVAFFSSPTALVEPFNSRIARTLRARGLDPGRHLEMLGRRDHAEYLGGVAAADLVLDSIGFSGGATSIDALSVGTPVVTLDGEFMRGRQTAAMLRMLGEDAMLVAGDLDGYVECAVALCRDAARREALRARLREKGPRLFDAPYVLPALQDFLIRAATAAAHVPLTRSPEESRDVRRV